MRTSTGPIRTRVSGAWGTLDLDLHRSPFKNRWQGAIWLTANTEHSDRREKSTTRLLDQADGRPLPPPAERHPRLGGSSPKRAGRRAHGGRFSLRCLERSRRRSPPSRTPAIAPSQPARTRIGHRGPARSSRLPQRRPRPLQPFVCDVRHSFRGIHSKEPHVGQPIVRIDAALARHLFQEATGLSWLLDSDGSALEEAAANA